jgi:hypothetical protein
MTSDGPPECECLNYGRDSSKCRLHWYREMDVRIAAEKAADIVMQRLDAASTAAPKRKSRKDARQ